MISALHFVQMLILCPRNLSGSVGGGGNMCRVREKTGFSKTIPRRVVALQCVMYNTCTGVCNKQQDGIVRSPQQGAPGHQHQETFSL